MAECVSSICAPTAVTQLALANCSKAAIGGKYEVVLSARCDRPTATADASGKSRPRQVLRRPASRLAIHSSVECQNLIIATVELSVGLSPHQAPVICNQQERTCSSISIDSTIEAEYGADYFLHFIPFSQMLSVLRNRFQ